MGCGASSSAAGVAAPEVNQAQEQGLAGAWASIAPSRLLIRRGSNSNAKGANVASPHPRLIRIILSRPFSRTEPMAELLRRCTFPILRDHCARRGWRLMVIDPSSEADPSQDPRPDTLAVIRRELQVCLQVSGGPALVSILDHTRGLPPPLPPSQIPEAEFEALRDWLGSQAGKTAVAQRKLGYRAGMNDSEVAVLLGKWYSQTDVSLTGERRGLYQLEVPPELRESSMFTGQGKFSGQGRDGRRATRAAELWILGEVLSIAAPNALCGREGLKALKRYRKQVKSRSAAARPYQPGGGGDLASSHGVAAAGGGGGGGGGLDPLGKLWEETERTEGGAGLNDTRTKREDVQETSMDDSVASSSPSKSNNGERAGGERAGGERAGRFGSIRAKEVLPGIEGGGDVEEEEDASQDGGGNDTDGQSIVYGTKYPAELLRKYEASACEGTFDMVKELAGPEASWRRGLLSVIHSSAGISGAPPKIAAGEGVKALFEIDAVKWKRVSQARQTKADMKSKVDAQLGLKAQQEGGRGQGLSLWGAGNKGKEERLPRHVRKELKRIGHEEDGEAEREDERDEGDEAVGDEEILHGALAEAEVAGGEEEDIFKGDMSLSITRIEVEGVSSASGMYCHVCFHLKDGGKCDKMTGCTVRRKAGRDGRVLWQSLTETTVGQRIVDEGLVSVKLMESRMVGTDRCLGEFCVVVSEIAHHEDKAHEEAGFWNKVLAPLPQKAGGERQAGGEVHEEDRGVVGSALLEIFVRNPGSGRDLVQKARGLINQREFGRALECLRDAVRRFLERGNSKAAAEAKGLIEEVEMRRGMSQPSMLRRLAWLRTEVMDEKRSKAAGGGGRAAAAVASFFRSSSAKEVGQDGQEGTQPGVQGKVLTAVDMPGQDGGAYEEALRVLEKELTMVEDGGWERAMMRAVEAFPSHAKVALRGMTAALLRSLEQSFEAASQGPQPPDPLMSEMALHEEVKAWHVARFIGRDTLVDKLTQYAFNNMSHPEPVQLVEGSATGVGVTALLASVCAATETHMQDRTPGTVLVYRACGASAASSDMEPLVHGIALQLECESGLERTDDEVEEWKTRARLKEQPSSYFAHRRRVSDIPFEYAEVCRHLRWALLKASARHPIVLIIDAIDLVRGHDIAETSAPLSTEGADLDPIPAGLAPLPRLLQWLPLQPSLDGSPGKLPPYCRVIIGYCGEEVAARTILKPLVAHKAHNLLNVRGIPCDGDAPARLLDRLNATAASMGLTKLSAAQLYDLLPPKASAEMMTNTPGSTRAEAPRVNPLALYLSFRVAVLSAERGRDANALVGGGGGGSKVVANGLVTGAKGTENAHDVAVTFLQTICNRHPGHAHRCLALLHCAQSGLTEDELIDLLSGAAKLRQSSSGEGSIKEMERADGEWAFQPPDCPQLDALRLVSDLAPVLRTISADGTRVITFSHRTFARAAGKVSCATPDARRRACLVIAAYFSGRDAAQSWLGGKEEVIGTQSAMQVLLEAPGFPSQPLLRDQVDAHRSLNLRSMRERVRALTGAGLYEAAREAVTDLGYCMAKAESGTLHVLLDEFADLVTERLAAPGQPRFLGFEGEFQSFISAHRGVISRYPAMIFQLAANCRDGAAARSANRHFEEMRGHPPWLRWRNPDSDETIASRWALRVHRSGLTAVAASADGEVVATAGNDRLACLWEVRNGRLLCALPKLMQRVSCMALSMSLSHVAIGDGDGQLKMWVLGSLGSSMGRTASEGGKLPKLPDTPEFGVSAHTGPVRGVAFLATPDLAVSCGEDGAVKVWMISTCSVLKVLGSHDKGKGSGKGWAATCVCVLRETASSVGVARRKRGAGGGQERIFSSGEDGCVREWSVNAGLVRVYEGLKSEATCVAACATVGIVAAGGEDMSVRVWSLSDGSRVATVQHDALVRFVAIDGPSATLVSVCDEGMMRLWDSRSFSRIGQVDASTNGGIRAPGGAGSTRLVCALEPHDGLICIGGAAGTLKSWEVRPPALRAHSGRLGGVRCMSVAGASMTSLGGGRGVAVWDLRTGMRKRELGGYQTCVSWVDMDPSRMWLLATASISGDVMLWDVRGGDSRQPAAPIHVIHAHVRGVKAVTFSPDGGMLATCGSDGLTRVYGVREPWGDHLPAAMHADHPPPQPSAKEDSVQVWLMHNLVGHTEGVISVRFSPDSSSLATISDDSTMRVWSMKSGGSAQIFAVAGGGGGGGGGTLTSVGWAPDMRSLVSGGSDGILRVWDVRSGKETMSLRPRRVLQLVNGFNIEAVGLGTAWSWNEVDGHRGGITCVAVSPDGALIVSGGQDGCVKAWSARGGRLVRTLVRCEGWVNAIAISADGGKVHAACSDGYVRALRMPVEGDVKLASGASPEEERGAGTSRSRAVKLAPIRGKGREGEGSHRSDVAQEEIQASVDDGKIVEYGQPLTKLALCGRATLLASVAEEQNVIEVRETAKLAGGLRKHHLRGHTDRVTDIATGEDTAWVISSSMDGLVKVWDASSGSCKHSQPCFRQGANSVTLCQPRELAAVGSVIGDVQLVDLSAGGGQISKFDGPEGSVVSLQFAGDGHLLMYAHLDGFVGVRDLRGNTAGDNRLIDANRGGKAGGLAGGIRALTKMIGGKEKRTEPTRGACCSPDGQMLFRAYGRSIEAWDMRMMRRLYVDNSHTGAVRGVRSLDNCSWIASGGSDCTVRIWCVPEGDGDGQVAPHEQWQDARSAAVQAGLYGQRDVLPARGPGQLSFNARQEVRCIAGFSVNAIYAGDSSGRIYALSLEPGLEPF